MGEGFLIGLMLGSMAPSFGTAKMTDAEKACVFTPLKDEITKTIHPSPDWKKANSEKAATTLCENWMGEDFKFCQKECEVSWRMGRLQDLTGDPTVKPETLHWGSVELPTIPPPLSAPVCYQWKDLSHSDNEKTRDAGSKIQSIENAGTLNHSIVGSLLQCCNAGYTDGRAAFQELLNNSAANSPSLKCATTECDSDVAKGQRDFLNVCNGRPLEKQFCIVPDDVKKSFVKAASDAKAQNTSSPSPTPSASPSTLVDDEPIHCFDPCYANGFDDAAAIATPSTCPIAFGAKAASSPKSNSTNDSGKSDPARNTQAPSSNANGAQK